MKMKFPFRYALFGVLGVLFSQVSVAVDNLDISTEPLSVSTERVEPNVVIVMDNSGSMSTRTGGRWSDTRMEVAREVASEVVNDVDGVRFGMFNFNNNDGGSLSSALVEVETCQTETQCKTKYECVRWNWSGTRCWDWREYVDYNDCEDVEVCSTENRTRYAECGIATKSELQGIISDFEPETWTPLGETLYEVSRYFRGLEPHFGTTSGYGDPSDRSRYLSPIQYRCQKNFVIVITDGLPTYDYDVPNTSDDPSIDGRSLPNWDGINDDNKNWSNQRSEGTNKYLDDVAMFGREIDFFSSSDGTDIKGGSWDDPLHPQQNMFTYTIGFQLDNELLEQTAAKGSGQYLTADNAQELKDALTSTLSDIASRVLSSSASAASSGRLVDADTFYPSYNSSNWSGELIKEKPDRSIAWKASEGIPGSGSRNIVFNDSGTARNFTWSNLSSAMKSYFGSYDKIGGNGSSVLNYLRGDQSHEAAGKYRIRTSLLGDIVNSTPEFVGEPNFRYPSDLEASPYSTFKAANKTRTPMVYVGSNDGMLHGFDASDGQQGGQERFAFIPQAVMRNMPTLSDSSYAHRYFVDGSPNVVDAFVDLGNGTKQWRSVLVAGLNAGGQSVYALDVTDPDSLGSSSFMWEFTDPDLGFSFSKPAIVRLADGTWAAVFGNGYNSTLKANVDDDKVGTSGNAVLFIVDLSDGSLIKKIDTGIGHDDDPMDGKSRPNGLGTVAPVDHDLDSVVDYVYAGDLFGNMWKFDLTPTNVNDPSSMSMSVDFGGNPLFVTSDDGSQPIMVSSDARPTVARHPKGGFLVYFGTGKYIETTDRSVEAAGMQSFYAIWDKNLGGDATPVTSRSQLLEQTINVETSASFGGETAEVRVTSDNEPNWSSHKGWFMDFNESTPNYERVVVTPTLRDDKVIFPTTIPMLKDDPCDSDSDSWLMELNALTGARLSYSAFDLDGDGEFGVGDKYGSGAAAKIVSGLKFPDELPKPTVLTDDQDSEVKIFNQNLRIDNEQRGPGFEGRQSWRSVEGS